MDFASAVRQALTGLSQTVLANKAGVSVDAVSTLEGKRGRNARVLFAVARGVHRCGSPADVERRGQGAGDRGDREQWQVCFRRGSAAWIVAAAIVRSATAGQRSSGGVSKDDEPRLVPAVVDPAHPTRRAIGSARRRAGSWKNPTGTIQVAIDGVTVRIGAGAPAGTIAAVLRALKAGA
ncbi:hypothetical protein [Tardiphaga sp. vice304]|uniref:hypothetical protein n=1 Tax=Tardiphaga sp. vice304 TaxID=2592817 RepID=UPI003F8DB235